MQNKILCYGRINGFEIAVSRFDLFDFGIGPVITGWRVEGLSEPTPEQLDAITDSMINDEARAAHLATLPIAKASLFRTTLRAHFGDAAETNRDVSQESAMAYFGQKVAAGTITPQETADSALLMALFPTLAALSPTQTTWDLPWEVLP